MNFNSKAFVALHQMRMGNFDDQNIHNKVDSLRFCLPQLEFLKQTRSDFDDRGALEYKELEIMKEYALLMDSKTNVNNYADDILSLNKGFKNDSKNWKCCLEASDLQNYLSQEEDLPEFSKEEYLKLGACLQASESKNLKKYLQSEPQNLCLSTEDETAPNFDMIDNDNLFSDENSSIPSSNHCSSSEPKRETFHPQSTLYKKYADARSSVPNKVSESLGEYPSEDRTFKDKKRYPWTMVKSRETSTRTWSSNKVSSRREEEGGAPSPQYPSFKTASHQLDLDNMKKYGGGRASSVKDMYGSQKRSLGARGIKGRFVPPVRKEDEEETRGSGETAAGGGGPYAELMLDERLKNIDAKMVELIMNEIMDNGSPVTWNDIAGLELAKSTIQEIVVWPMLRPDIFTGLRGPPKGILLFGPPGTGKTMIGKCIASQSESTFFSISASSLTSKWVGEGEKMVRAMFAVAKCHQPAVIFIDEIDSLLTQRSDTEHESSRRIKTEFLVQLDGATSADNDRILVVGATNRPQELDEAARRRLVKRLYIPLPDAVAREQIIRNLLHNQGNSLSDSEVKEISEKTDGYSGADMANLCREAALGPIRSLKFTDIQLISVEQVRPISAEDFIAALHSIRASVSSKDLELYEEWNKKYGINCRG